MTNHFGSSLLYRNASGLEKAMADIDSSRLIDINAELIKDIWNPYTCPIHLLPYLAWAMGATFWNDDWSEDTKRSWVARQWEFKQKRGTDAGIEMVVDYAGRDVSPYGYQVLDIATAPNKIFPGAALSNEAREAWLEHLPQVRVYQQHVPITSSPDKAFVKNFCGVHDHYLQVCIPSTAKERLGPQALWIVNGQDTNITVTQDGSVYKLCFPSVEGDGSYAHHSWTAGQNFLIPSTAWSRLVTVRPSQEYPYRFAVGPSVTAISAKPDHIFIKGNGELASFCGSNYEHGGGVHLSPGGIELTSDKKFPCFLVPSTARFRVFERYAVFDPTLPPPVKNSPATAFCGVGRFGVPPFTAEIDLSMSSRDVPWNFRAGDIFEPKGLYLIPHDSSRVEYVCGAVETARKMIDKCLLKVGRRPTFVAGKPFIADRDHYAVVQ